VHPTYVFFQQIPSLPLANELHHNYYWKIAFAKPDRILAFKMRTENKVLKITWAGWAFQSHRISLGKIKSNLKFAAHQKPYYITNIAATLAGQNHATNFYQNQALFLQNYTIATCKTYQLQNKWTTDTNYHKSQPRQRGKTHATNFYQK
jgi:hypothetical protein